MKYPPLRKLLLSSAFLVLPFSARAETSRPNVVFILVDDMGWGDLGVFFQNDRGTSPKFSTPNLDTMAAEGIQLRRHYTAAPVCAPARASLLLGVHQGHANVRDNQFDKALENNHTLGTVMQEAGYATAAIGKWGLPGDGLPAPARPELRGFDYFFGYLDHRDAHWHYPKETGANVYDGTVEVTADLDKCYSTDFITARAKKWILDHNTASSTQPFFLYLAYSAPHARLDVPTQAYPAGKGEFGGVQWDGTPGAMINTANGTINSFIHPDYAGQSWSETAKRHATMMRRIDDAVADIIQTLKDRGIDNDTLIIFTSDNGPHDETGNGGSYKYDPRFFDSYGLMDGIKRDTWEGGIREPALVRWPGHIPAGVITYEASQFHDWMPTLTDAVGLPAPARSDGVSLLPTLTGVGTQRDSTIYIEYYNGGSTPGYSEFEPSRRGALRRQEQVIHLDGYKGIRYNVTGSTDDFEIYDTLVDPKETNNLAGESGFDDLQQRMKDRVLQVRRPGDESRPYDTSLIPPVTVANTVSGLDYRAFEGDYPWVPDFNPLTSAAAGAAAGVDLAVRTRDDNIGMLYTGYLDVPNDGIYTIYLETDGRAFLRLHDASIIDADFGYTGGTERAATVRLKAGKHPLRLGYIHGDTGGTHTLTLKWSANTNPVLTKQTIPAANLLRVNSGVLGANNDAATAVSGIEKAIDVLANDVIGSGPGPLALTAVTPPAHGSAVIDGDRVLYTSLPGYTGPDSFSYTMSDGTDSEEATVSVTVMAAIPPTANPDQTSTPAGTPVHIPVLVNDSDDGVPSALSISGVTPPGGGTAVILGNDILYTPFGGVLGEDRFFYTVTDGQDSDTAQVTVTVSPVTSEIWLPLNETSGTVVGDPLGRPLGVLQNFGASPWTTGNLDGALAFDGVDDQVVLTGIKGVTGRAARTVAFWINADAAQNPGMRPTMVSWGADNSGANPGARFDINLTDSDGYHLRAEFNSAGVNFSTSTHKDLRGAGWVHCAIVMPANATVSQLLCYLDGVAATAAVYPSNSGGTAIDTDAAHDITLGRISDGSSDRAFKGLLDDVRIYPRALDADEIELLTSQNPEQNVRNQWYFRHSGNSTPTAGDWEADTDHDSYNTVLEFALGGNPTIGSTEIAPVFTDGLDFVFNRSRDGILPEDYVVEISENLTAGSWQPSGTPSVAPHPELDGYYRITVNLEDSVGLETTTFFVRLRVDW